MKFSEHGLRSVSQFAAFRAGNRGANWFWVLAWMLWVTAVPGMWAAGPALAHHEPAQPKSGQPVRIVVDRSIEGQPGDLVVEYQSVAPGQYVAKANPQYVKSWTAIALSAGPGGEWAAEIPARVQQHRQLIRYRVRSVKSKAVVVPPREDAQGNLAYFVYDGVPAWRGAVNPRGDSAARDVKTFRPEVLTRVPVYHWIAAKDDVEKVMWREPNNFNGDEARHAYKYTGTLVCDGVVYDHVRFRARGGSWRHAMGKNMWKFNFNLGHRFEAADDYGRPYAAKWDKLNLGACIQQGDYGMRGEQGMFESLSFRLFNLAGAEAPHTHWIHLRVVTEAEESPADQYRGDFWGLYLATEEIDGAFLKEHALPGGNVYKIEGFAPHVEHVADPAHADAADAQAFLAEVLRGGSGEKWWRANVDLPRYYAYRAVLEAVHHYDIDSGKNYFFYHNLTARRWQVIPWDVDLTWGERMYGGGQEPFVDGVLRRSPALRAEYQERLAELMDLLLNPEALGRLIDEQAAWIWDASGGLSLADADRAKWDYHPIMSSPLSLRGKSDPGLFYRRNPANRFDVMIAGMKKFAAGRQAHLARLLSGYQPPAAPQLTGPKTVRPTDGPLRLTATGEPVAAHYRWRLADVTRSTGAASGPATPWHHEILPLWESAATDGAGVEVPTTRMERGHTYRIRVKGQAPEGRWSRWSAPLELVAE